ncbi:MAG: carboxypeptidase-like regulatory domain-containing protein, partial [Desulfobacula sp.]
NLRVKASQILDVGDIFLPPGVAVTGTIVDPEGNPVPGVFLEYHGGNLRGGGFQTDGTGQFSIILPKGTFAVSPSDDAALFYTPEFNFVTIKNTSTPVDMGNLVVYPANRTIPIQGTATGPQRYDGDMFVAAFPEAFSLILSTESAAEPLSYFSGINPENPVYSFPVPPQNEYMLFNGFENRSSSGKDSITIVNRKTQWVGSSPLDDVDFTMTDRGYFVLGGVSGNGDIGATIGLYDLTGPSPVMTGLTYSDTKGRFEFYNVPSGNYKIAAFVPETGAEFSSGAFTVSDSAVTISDILLVNDGFGPDTDQDKDIDGVDLSGFSGSLKPGVPVPAGHPMDQNADGFVDGKDLKIFSQNFGKSIF